MGARILRDAKVFYGKRTAHLIFVSHFRLTERLFKLLTAIHLLTAFSKISILDVWQIFLLRENVRIRSFSGPYFPAFGLNIERFGVSLRIQSQCGKMQTRKTPNRNTFHAVFNTPLHNQMKKKSWKLKLKKTLRGRSTFIHLIHQYSKRTKLGFVEQSKY